MQTERYSTYYTLHAVRSEAGVNTTIYFPNSPCFTSIVCSGGETELVSRHLCSHPTSYLVPPVTYVRSQFGSPNIIWHRDTNPGIPIIIIKIQTYAILNHNKPRGLLSLLIICVMSLCATLVLLKVCIHRQVTGWMFWVVCMPPRNFKTWAWLTPCVIFILYLLN